jgi:hypothetical protein
VGTAEDDGRMAGGDRIGHELGSVMQDEDAASDNAHNLGFRKRFRPGRGVDVAAHRYHGRDFAQPFEYLWLADISSMDDQFRAT